MTTIVETIPTEELEHLPAEPLLAWAAAAFPSRIAVAASFGAEDVVIIDMLSRVAPAVRVFTLDTGRLPAETYAVMEAVRARYGLAVDVLFPRTEAVEAMVRERGMNLFYRSVEDRKRCCQVRKVEPLGRALAGFDAWITGLRRDPAGSRTAVRKVEAESGRPGRVKVNPLADWTWEQVWAYVREHDVPHSALHAQGYPSIGCAPCTRAVAPGEDLRAGRWWWEDAAAHKECGLHVTDADRVAGRPS